MINPEFVRDIHSNYMKLSCGQGQIKKYELSILEQNHIAGLLPMRVSHMDDTAVFAYEISNTQSLESYYAQRDINGDELVHTLEAIDRLLHILEPYLLEMDHIILDPAYIFLHLDRRELLFCYYPGYDGEVRESLRRLSDFFIDKLNHKDAGAVQLGYLFFRKAREENFNLSDLVKGLLESEEMTETGLRRQQDAFPDPAAAGGPGPEKPSTPVSESRQEDPLPQIPPPETFFPELDPASSHMETTDSHKKKTGFFSFLNRSDKHIREKKEKKHPYVRPSLPVYAVEKAFFQGGEVPSRPGIVRESEGSAEEEVPRLVPVENGSEEPEGDKMPVTFLLDQLPYIIGTLSYAVDGLLDRDGIERFHARIQKNGDQYVLIDLNSKKGTYLNGEKCKAAKEYPLHSGDQVTFARYTYRFTL